MKVRIRKTPAVDELDGVRLDDMMPGSVREVSPSIGSWLIVERCAVPEMRRSSRAHEEDFLVDRDPDSTAGHVIESLRRRLDERG